MRLGRHRRRFIASDALTGVRSRYVEWQNSNTEQGDIGGLKFARTFWGGVRSPDAPAPVRGQKTHGFVYLAIEIVAGPDRHPDHPRWSQPDEPRNGPPFCHTVFADFHREASSAWREV
jgi:hypothetical protein